MQDMVIPTLRHVGKSSHVCYFGVVFAQSLVGLYSSMRSDCFTQTLATLLCTRVLGITFPAFSCPCPNTKTGKIRTKEPTCGRRDMVTISTRIPCQLFHLAHSTPPQNCNIRLLPFPTVIPSRDMSTCRWTIPTGGLFTIRVTPNTPCGGVEHGNSHRHG